MKNVWSIAIIALLSFPAHSAIDTNMSFPQSFTAFVPCAAGGAGEVVTLSGNLHVLITTTVNGNHISSVSHFQPQGVSGVGSVTGDKYQATGITKMSFEADVVAFPFVQTFVNNFKIIGQGPNNNFLLHENAHITVNADGTVIVSMDNLSVECR